MDFTRAAAESMAFEREAEEKFRAIATRDQEFQTASGLLTSALTPEGQEAARVVTRELERQRAAFHRTYAPAIRAQYVALLEAVETANRQAASALRALDAFENETNDFYRRTGSRARLTVANRDLPVALEEHATKAAAARQDPPAPKATNIVARVLARPVFADLLGR